MIKPVTVYNFQVEDFHTYHVGESGVLVHNVGDGYAEAGAKDAEQYFRKADGFAKNLRGAQKSYPTDGTPGAIRYTKNGKYLITAPDGTYISFGKAT